jgi:hypothetical protein
MTKISISDRVIPSGDIADESFSAMHDPRSKVMDQVKEGGSSTATPSLRCWAEAVTTGIYFREHACTLVPQSTFMSKSFEQNLEFIFLGTGTSSSVPHVDCLTAPPERDPCRTCLSTLTPQGWMNVSPDVSTGSCDSHIAYFSADETRQLSCV